MLIDSGASNSIINPNTAIKYFKDFFFKRKFTVKSLGNTITNNENISYPLLKEYDIDHNIQFQVIQWHDRFDALIGSYDFKKLGAKIDYKNNILEIGKIKIPFFIDLNQTISSHLKKK